MVQIRTLEHSLEYLITSSRVKANNFTSYVYEKKTLQSASSLKNIWILSYLFNYKIRNIILYDHFYNRIVVT